MHVLNYMRAAFLLTIYSAGWCLTCGVYLGFKTPSKTFAVSLRKCQDVLVYTLDAITAATTATIYCYFSLLGCCTIINQKQLQ